MSTLTLEQLIQENPELYVQAKEQGIQLERERCLALLPAKANDPISVYALRCIRNGAPLGYKQQANYLCLQMNALRKGNEAATVVAIVEANLGVNRDGNASN